MSPAPARAWKGLVFKLGSIPVLIQPMFFFFAIVFGPKVIDQGAIWLAVLFVSILGHELGHALAMRAFGFSPSIELHALGGFTRWSTERRPTAVQVLIVTCCGPGAGLVLSAAATMAISLSPGRAEPLLAWGLFQLQWVNLRWSLINLLPVLPWDGGLIVDSAVHLVGRRPRPKIAGAVSLVFGALVAAFGAWRREPILIYFGGMGVWHGWTRLNPAVAAPNEDLRALLNAEKYAEAEQAAMEAILKATPGPERAALYELVAWARAQRHDWPGAEAALAQMGRVRPSPLVAGTIAAHAGRYDEVVALLTPLPTGASELALRAEALISLGRGDAVVADANEALLRSQDAELKAGVQRMSALLFQARAFEQSLQVCLAAFARLGDPIHLFNAACALVKLGRADEAMGTLHRAVDAGYQQRPALLDDPDLAPLRQLTGWSGLISRLPAQAV